MPDITQLMKKIQMDDYGVRKMDGDKKLTAEAENLIDRCQTSLHTEYSFYSIYLQGSSVYALVHAFYNESDEIREDNLESIVKKDCQYLQGQLIKSNLNLDYFFVMPYFDYIDKTKGSVLYESVKTNEI